MLSARKISRNIFRIDNIARNRKKIIDKNVTKYPFLLRNYRNCDIINKSDYNFRFSKEKRIKSYGGIKWKKPPNAVNAAISLKS